MKCILTIKKSLCAVSCFHSNKLYVKRSNWPNVCGFLNICTYTSSYLLSRIVVRRMPSFTFIHMTEENKYKY